MNTDEGRRVCFVRKSRVFASELERDERVSRKHAEEAVLMLIEGNPHRLRQPGGWICDAELAQGLVEYPQEPEDVRQALNAGTGAPATS